MDAHVIVKGTKVEGVYAADPRTHRDAERIDHISFSEVLSRELAVMDATAISLCKDNNLPIIVLNILTPGAVLAALRGERIGTLVTSDGER
jgi:uridylate kinase